mmetsp:Transcript_60964/g.125659  ORF Transcript_60964/g.125659 Transcript_60964/m.125659 type:complete len:293 (+) Transcript_60964:35-913(+)
MGIRQEGCRNGCLEPARNRACTQLGKEGDLHPQSMRRRCRCCRPSAKFRRDLCNHTRSSHRCLYMSPSMYAYWQNTRRSSGMVFPARSMKLGSTLVRWFHGPAATHSRGPSTSCPAGLGRSHRCGTLQDVRKPPGGLLCPQLLVKAYSPCCQAPAGHSSCSRSTAGSRRPGLHKCDIRHTTPKPPCGCPRRPQSAECSSGWLSLGPTARSCCGPSTSRCHHQALHRCAGVLQLEARLCLQVGLLLSGDCRIHCFQRLVDHFPRAPSSERVHRSRSRTCEYLRRQLQQPCHLH